MDAPVARKVLHLVDDLLPNLAVLAAILLQESERDHRLDQILVDLVKLRKEALTALD